MLIDANISNIVIYLTPFVVVFGVYYLYALYSLYIGRNPKKYKIVILIYNFSFLILFIFTLIFYSLYDSASGIILMILLLAIIILGITGGFMYDTNSLPKKNEKTEKTEKIFLIILKITSLLAILSFATRVAYNLLTKTVEITSNITYVGDNDFYEELWGLRLEFNKEHQATLSYMFFDENFNVEEINGIVIYIDDKIIYTSNEVILNLYEENGFFLNFYYSFTEIKAFDSPSVIKIQFTINQDIKEYDYINPDYSVNKEYVTLPIWSRD